MCWVCETTHQRIPHYKQLDILNGTIQHCIFCTYFKALFSRKINFIKIYHSWRPFTAVISSQTLDHYYDSYPRALIYWCHNAFTTYYHPSTSEKTCLHCSSSNWNWNIVKRFKRGQLCTPFVSHMYVTNTTDNTNNKHRNVFSLTEGKLGSYPQMCKTSMEHFVSMATVEFSLLAISHVNFGEVVYGCKHSENWLASTEHQPLHPNQKLQGHCLLFSFQKKLLKW